MAVFSVLIVLVNNVESALSPMAVSSVFVVLACNDESASNPSEVFTPTGIKNMNITS